VWAYSGGTDEDCLVKNAKKHFPKSMAISTPQSKACELDDRSIPARYQKNIGDRKSFPATRWRLPHLITLRDDPDNDCYVLAVKRRTSTTYLHEEKAPYGCSANQGR
jgi:hypothetical protein